MFDSTDLLASLPRLPGVYRMLDVAGQVLYVGKAGDLKKRVSSYFQKNDLSPRIRSMVSQIAGVETTVTRSEAEALLLENNLIKALSPRYNILFRDDKSYPYLLLTGHAYPRLAYFRGTPKPGDDCFGPFPHAMAVRESIDILQKVFRLRTCEDSVLAHRSRPCLLFQINRCSAPCVKQILVTDYARDVAHARQFLSGKADSLTQVIAEQMRVASEAQQYEMAARWRDQLRSLAAVRERQVMNTQEDLNADVVVVVGEAGQVCVNVAMVRGGQHLGDRSFFPRNIAARDDEPFDAEEVLLAFLSQHYLQFVAPAQIIVSERVDLKSLSGLLSERAGHEVQVLSRVQGERRRWLDMARHNARLALLRRLSAGALQTRRMTLLRERLALPEMDRIECFDISHTMGEAAVASCVVYAQEAMQPAQYRRYNLRETAAGDDYGAMREALRRRYVRVQEGEGVLPDLLLIDGGLGQVRAVMTVLTELGIHDLAVVGVAKGVTRKAGLEQLVSPDGSVRRLAPEDAALHLIQEIRDEAHRFAITGHRARRAKTRQVSALEEIPGVGPKRRQKLLARFGGLRELRNAALEDIAGVEGISEPLAQAIYQALH
jgi:excinuclease ABC subunit C